MRKKKNREMIKTESYEIKYWHQKPDGYWTQGTTIKTGYTKSNHHKVCEGFLKENPNARVISVRYQ